MQERNGNIYVPSAPKISGEIGTYEIYQIPATADVDYYFRSYEAAKENSRALIISVLTPVCTQREIRWRICGQNTTATTALCPSDAFHVCKRHRGTDAGWKENRLLHG